MKVKQPPLIRLVDDDPTVCESLAFVLEVAGLQVKGYSSALDFLAWDDREREGCLLLDVRMPEMTGLELQRRLRSEGVDLPRTATSRWRFAPCARGRSTFSSNPRDRKR